METYSLIENKVFAKEEGGCLIHTRDEAACLAKAPLIDWEKIPGGGRGEDYPGEMTLASLDFL